MKYVSENLLQFKDDNFFNLLYETAIGADEVKDEMTPEEKEKMAKELEKQGLGIVKKLHANFSIFKSIALDDWKQYRDFWNEQKTSKEAQASPEGIFYKMYDSKYVVGVTETEDGSAELTVWNTEIEDEFDDHIVFQTKSAEVIKSFMSFYKEVFEGEMRSIISKEKEKLEKNKAEAVKKEKEEEMLKAKEKVNAFMTESAEDVPADDEKKRKWLVDYFKKIWSKSKPVTDLIFNNDELWEKYKHLFGINFDWNAMTLDELVNLWDEWNVDSEKFDSSNKYNAEMNESKKTQSKKGPKPLSVPNKPNPANKTTPSKPPKNKKKK